MSRRERRTAARAAAKDFERARKVVLPIAPEPDTPTRAKTRAASATTLRSDRTLAGLERAVGEVETLTDQLVEVAFEISGFTPACERGCSYCCHLHVSVSVPEVLHAVEYARRSLDPAIVERIRARARENAERVRGKTPATYPPRLPCAFLEGSQCSIYAVRPMLCRREHAERVDACRASFEGERDAVARKDPGAWEAAHRVRLGYREGLEHAGLDSYAATYELQQATAIAFEVEDATARWLAGEPVFAAARSVE